MIKLPITLASIILLSACWNTPAKLDNTVVKASLVHASVVKIEPTVTPALIAEIDKVIEPELVTETAQAPAPIEITVPETRRVCIEVFDSKTKKNITKCRTMTIHKKYQSTPVPKK